MQMSDKACLDPAPSFLVHESLVKKLEEMPSLPLKSIPLDCITRYDAKNGQCFICGHQVKLH